MKIVRAIRDLYVGRSGLYQRLAKDVEERLKPLAESRDWFFLSRVKTLESYALKLETGRVEDPSHLEDFFACTIVVKNLSEIDSAEEVINSIYSTNHRRPQNSSITHKTASSFDFDDLRLYVAQPSLETGKNSDLDGLIFEVQVKTILQHAWGVATHDLTYKADSVSWSRERIAFQVKAMLEHAELAIAEASKLADSSAVAKKDKKTGDILKIMQIFREVWNADKLPDDKKRLAENISQLLHICNITPEDLQDVINIEKRRVGMLPGNLSPYAFIVQALAQNININFKEKIERRNVKTKVLVHADMDVPIWMLEPHQKILLM